MEPLSHVMTFRPVTKRDVVMVTLIRFHDKNEMSTSFLRKYVDTPFNTFEK